MPARALQTTNIERLELVLLTITALPLFIPSADWHVYALDNDTENAAGIQYACS